MTVLVTPIYTVLTGDGTLTANLSTYKGLPAIFSNAVAPHDADFPFVIIGPPTQDTNFDTLKEFGRDIAHDIWVIFENTGSITLLDSTAERVRALFHKTTALTVTGYEVVQTYTQGPFDGMIEGRRSGFQIDEVPAIARRVNVRAILRTL